jgi:hypothetical protein
MQTADLTLTPVIFAFINLTVLSLRQHLILFLNVMSDQLAKHLELCLKPFIIRFEFFDLP